MGSRGTMIPIPSIDEKTEKKRMTKTLLFTEMPFSSTNGYPQFPDFEGSTVVLERN